jgi:hypothetical protein
MLIVGVIMCWTEPVQTALKQGAECHKKAAELIMAAMVAHSLNQREVGKALDKSTTWISRLLKWYKGGCQGTAFGPEAARRRKIATSQQKPYFTPQEMGQPELDFGGTGYSDYRPGQREANLRAAAMEAQCVQTTRLARELSSDQLELILSSENIASRRHLLRQMLKKVKNAKATLSVLEQDIRAELARISDEKFAPSFASQPRELEAVLH